MGITAKTLYEWQNRFSEVRDALKKGKAPVNYEVENALLKRALGYDYDETVTETYIGNDGVEKTHVRTYRKHMPPETTAIIFWLKNRRPERWRDKVEAPVSQDKNEPIYELLRRIDNECGV